jgi:isoleucyl-tRNA synthetase
MESVIWAFKQLYDKGLAYEGFRILPYCWNDQTPLSNHELRMDEDVYQNRQDPAITVGYRLETGELALIWTTTPWTLPSNMGVAVHPDVDYVVVEGDKDGGTDRYLLARRGSRHTPASSGTTRPSGSSRATRAPSWSGAATRRRSPTTGVCRGAPDLGRGLRHDRGRHRAGPHVARASVRTTRPPSTRSGVETVVPVGRTGASPTR